MRPSDMMMPWAVVPGIGAAAVELLIAGVAAIDAGALTATRTAATGRASRRGVNIGGGVLSGRFVLNEPLDPPRWRKVGHLLVKPNDDSPGCAAPCA